MLTVFFFHYHSIGLEDVCNGRLDCIDGSDEENCKSIVFGDSYLQNVPPIPNSMN